MTRFPALAPCALLALLAACGSDGGPSTASTEASLAACQDGIDNDGDGWTDCDDQDCEIFAVCVSTPDTGGSDTGDTGTDASDASDASDSDAETDGPDADVSPDAADVADVSDTEDTTDATDATDAADSSETPDASDAVDDSSPPDPCEGAGFCLQSTFTLTNNEEIVNGIPSSNTFVPLIGTEVGLTFGCNVLSSALEGDYYDIMGIRRATVCTVTNVHVDGDDLPAVVASLADALGEASLRIDFADAMFWGSARFDGMYFTAGPTDGYTLEWSSFDMAVDGAEGSPELTPFESKTNQMTVRRFIGGEMSDYTTGTNVLTLERRPLAD